MSPPRSAPPPTQVREGTDAVLAAFWQAVADQARQREGGEDSALIVDAGLAAAPYLLRRHDWDTASTLLEHAIVRDESPGVIQAALPALRRVAAATQAPDDLAILGRALQHGGPGRSRAAAPRRPPRCRQRRSMTGSPPASPRNWSSCCVIRGG